MSEDNTAAPDLRDLRAKAERAEAAEKANAELQRQLLFAQAGINVDPEVSKLGSMLFATSKATTVDAVKAEALEIGLLKGPETQTPAAPHPDAAQQQFRQTLAPGTPALPDNTGVDPYDDAFTHFFADMKAGMSRDRAQLGAIDRVLTAGANGDKRVRFDADAWTRQALAEDSLPV